MSSGYPCEVFVAVKQPSPELSTSHARSPHRYHVFQEPAQPPRQDVDWNPCASRALVYEALQRVRIGGILGYSSHRTARETTKSSFAVARQQHHLASPIKVGLFSAGTSLLARSGLLLASTIVTAWKSANISPPVGFRTIAPCLSDCRTSTEDAHAKNDEPHPQSSSFWSSDLDSCSFAIMSLFRVASSKEVRKIPSSSSAQRTG